MLSHFLARTALLAALITTSAASPACSRQPPPPTNPQPQATAPSIPLPAGGWTNLTPPRDALVLHISNSGSDIAPGTPEAPLRTLSAGYAKLRDGHPDQLLLKCGDTFEESINWAKSARGNGRMIVSKYGSGPLPKIRTRETAFHIGNSGPDGLGFFHLDIAPKQPTSGSSAFVIFTPANNVRIEGCHCTGFASNIVAQEVNTTARGKGLVIHRCVIADSQEPGPGHSQNIFLGAQDDWEVTECVLDRCGVGQKNMFNQNLYAHESNGPGKFIGNITARACASGFQQRPGGTADWNLCLQNPINGYQGKSASDHPAATNYFRNNCAIDSRDIAPKQGRGFGFHLGGADTTIITGNIVAHQVSGTDAIYGYNLDGINAATFSHNVCYDWGLASNDAGWPTAVQWEPRGAGPVTFSNNILGFKAGQFGICIRNEGRGLENVTYSSNRYFTAQEPKGKGGYGSFHLRAGEPGNKTKWFAAAGETGSTFGPLPVVDVSVSSYLNSLKIEPGADPMETYMTHARAMTIDNYRAEFTAAPYILWAQTKFGIAAP